MKIFSRTILAFIFFLLVTSLQAQQTAPSPATLKFQNREIVTFRAILAGKTPEQRADAALKRLRALSGMSLYQPIKAETIPDGYIFAIEDNILLALVKDD
jgi:hypothetical protein